MWKVLVEGWKQGPRVVALNQACLVHGRRPSPSEDRGCQHDHPGGRPSRPTPHAHVDEERAPADDPNASRNPAENLGARTLSVEDRAAQAQVHAVRVTGRREDGPDGPHAVPQVSGNPCYPENRAAPACHADAALVALEHRDNRVNPEVEVRPFDRAWVVARAGQTWAAGRVYSGVLACWGAQDRRVAGSKTAGVLVGYCWVESPEAASKVLSEEDSCSGLGPTARGH